MDQFRRVTSLLVRRLRVDLRGVGGHLVRAFAAACLLFTIFAVSQSGLSLAAPGLMVYRWIVWVDSLLISIGSVTIFASVITSEREQGTLPLLRMTGTTPISLLLGQGFSGVVLGCLLLAVQMPFVVLTITLGGVLWDQVLATFLALLAHLVLGAGLGLFWSVLCLRSGTASFYTLLSICGLWLGTMLARLALKGLVTRGWISNAMESAVDSATVWLDQRLVWSTLSGIATSFGVLDLVTPQFWWSLGAGVALMLAGAFLLDRRPLEVLPYSPIVIRLWRSSGNRAWRRLAIAGKDYRQFMGGIKGGFARLVVYLIVPLGTMWAIASFTTNSLRDEDFTTSIFWFGTVFLMIEAAVIAARLFRNELAEQTWSSLAVLPRRRLRILAEKLCGAWLGIVPGLLVCLIAGAWSSEVRRFFFETDLLHHRERTWLVLALQPLIWVVVTGMASLLMVGAPPTVTVFLGLVALLVQYFLGLLVALLIFGNRLRFEEFTLVYFIASCFLIPTCGLIAAIRLQKLTQRS